MPAERRGRRARSTRRPARRPVPTAVTCDLWAKTGTLAAAGRLDADLGLRASAGGARPCRARRSSSTRATRHRQPDQPAVRDDVASCSTASPAPDLTGVAPRRDQAVYLHRGRPGTYLYEAGLLPGTQYQAARASTGPSSSARPALLQANDDAATAFDDEALVVLGEVDTALNTSAHPGLRPAVYAPRYFLINGTAYARRDRPHVTTAAIGCSCAIWTRASSTTRWACSASASASSTTTAPALQPSAHGRRDPRAGPGRRRPRRHPGDGRGRPRCTHSMTPRWRSTTARASGIGGMLAFIDAAGTASGGDSSDRSRAASPSTPPGGSLTARSATPRPAAPAWPPPSTSSTPPAATVRARRCPDRSRLIRRRSARRSPRPRSPPWRTARTRSTSTHRTAPQLGLTLLHDVHGRQARSDGERPHAQPEPVRRRQFGRPGRHRQRRRQRQRQRHGRAVLDRRRPRRSP